MIYPSAEDLLGIAEVVIGQPPLVRDYGLLASAAARPATVVFGHEPYPTVQQKAAALLESLALNHALVDGNKRLAFAAAMAFCDVNTGRMPLIHQGYAYNMVIAVCEHKLTVDEVAEILLSAGQPIDSTIRARAQQLAEDPADRAEMRAVMEDMDGISAEE